jgi:dUTP pyrophosphatase
MYANTSEANGYLQLHHHDGINHATFTMYMENRLWYHYLHHDTSMPPMTAKVRKMSSLSEYELWHHRLGHPSSAVLEKMHKYARGVPKLRTPDFYNCQLCTLGKIRKDSSTSTRSTKKSTPIQPTERIHPGQHLHMDFGFVRGSAFSKKDKHGCTITSIDGFRSYLIIVDRATHYKWLFLTTTKHPPIHEIETILKQFHHLSQTTHATVRTYQGGELGCSHAFQSLLQKYDYAYEPTGTNSSKQNGMAERPNQDLKCTTRCLLRTAGLDSSHWSYAINHAVYLANCIYHSTIKMSPFQAMHHTQPELGHLKAFGSLCYYKHTKTNQKSMDIAGNQGIFLGYTASQKNVYVKSTSTNKVHIALHKSFNKAHMTTLTETIPPMAQVMQKAGYSNSVASPTDTAEQVPTDSIKVQLLSEYAIEPTRSTELSAGLDIYSAKDHLILPHSHLIIPTNIAIQPMQGIYAQLCTQSSMTAKGISVLGGVIDADYRGNIKVILQNNSNEPFEIKRSQRIAQMIVKKISPPTVAIVPTLQATAHGQKG